MKSVCNLERRALLRSGMALSLAGVSGATFAAGSDAQWKSWAGNLSADPGWRIYPRSLNDLRQALRSGPAPIRHVGAGWSTAPLCPTNGTMVDLSHLQGVVAWNDSLGRVRVRAGSTLESLGPMLAKVGQALPTMGDAAAPTLAGAIATATHGSGVEMPSLSAQVTAAQLVTADGDVLEINERENSEMLPAVACSLGALGVLTELEIKTVPAHRLREDIASVDLEESLKSLRTIQRNNQHVELAVYPYSDTAILRRMNPTSDAVTEAEAMRIPQQRILAALTRAGHDVPPLDGPLQMGIAALYPGGSRVGQSDQIMPVAAPLRFEAMEYAMPTERGIDALLELREEIRKADLNVMLPLQLRFVSQDAAWLSPFYRQDSVTVAVKQWTGAQAQKLFALAQPIFRRHGGRPHWGFNHSLVADELADLYPRWTDFQDLRKRLDPKGRLLNEGLQKMLRA